MSSKNKGGREIRKPKQAKKPKDAKVADVLTTVRTAKPPRAK